MDYKDKFYTEYVSTHILPRKGSPTLEEFENRSLVYQKQFGRFLPQEKSSKIIEACYKFFLFVEIGRGKRIVTQDIIAVAKKVR